MAFDPATATGSATYKIDHTKVDATLTNFPVPIKLPTDCCSDLDARLLKMAVKDSSNQLYVEIERWDNGNDANTTFLLQSNNSDGDTSFTDSSSKGHVISRGGDAHHEVDQHKFGKSSIYFDGTGDMLTTPTSSDWTFGSDDFTVDLWVYIPSVQSGERCLCGLWTISSETQRWVLMLSSGKLKFYTNTGTYSSGTAASALTINTWHHIAVVRSGDDVDGYVDGVSVFTFSLAGKSFSSSTAPLEVGMHSSSYVFKGYIDELRVSTGVARWTGAFTPQTISYSAPSGTIHVKVPSISSSADTDLTLYWDSTQDDNTTYIGESGGTVAQSVWDSDFDIVNHFAQDPSSVAPQLLDSTSNNNDGTTVGSMTSANLVDADDVGKVIEFDGSDDYVDFGDITSGVSLSNATIEIRFKSNDDSADQYLLSKDASGANVQDFSFIVSSGSADGKLYAHPGTGGDMASATSITDGLFRHYVYTQSSSTGRALWDEGVKTHTDTETSGVWGNTEHLCIAATSGGLSFANVSIAEIRVSKIVRSDAWIKATSYALKNELLTAPIPKDLMKPAMKSIINPFPVLGGV